MSESSNADAPRRPARPQRVLLLSVAVMVVALALAGLTLSRLGGSVRATVRAEWAIDQSEPPDPSSRSLAVEVWRTECAGGRTGPVHGPEVRETEDRVLLSFSVDRLRPGIGYGCPTNDRVRTRVQLRRALGTRELVDGGCLESAGADASECVRWVLPK